MLLALWGKEHFTRDEFTAYMQSKGVGRTTSFNKFNDLVDQQVIEFNPKTRIATYVGVVPVSLVQDYALQAADLMATLNATLIRAVYGPVAVANAHSRTQVTPDAVRPIQSHIAETRQTLLSLAELLWRMERADLTSPDLAVILDNTGAVQRLTELRKGFDQS